jgi:hypothetical protein
VPEDIWQVLRDGSHQVRVNLSLRAKHRRRGLPVKVSVRLDVPDVERAELEALERRIHELVADRAVHAAARTGGDELELTYYAATGRWVDDLIEAIEADDADRSVAVSGERDPRWDAVTRWF